MSFRGAARRRLGRAAPIGPSYGDRGRGVDRQYDHEHKDEQGNQAGTNDERGGDEFSLPVFPQGATTYGSRRGAYAGRFYYALWVAVGGSSCS